MLEIIIKGGMVIDGTGETPAFRSDIGISNGKISALGDLSKERAHRQIDASGQIVCPGFIDIQNHSDSYGALLRTPTLESMLCQGVTTVLLGHGGSSLAPLMKGSLASIQKWTDVSGINVDWRSMAEFLEIVAVKGSGPNVATLVGHGTLRRDFAGDEMRTLSNEERQKLLILLRRSLSEGAWGISMGLQYTHEQSAEQVEINEVLSLVKEKRGVASFHLRDEAKGFFASLQEVIDYAKESSVKTKIARVKIEHETDPTKAEEAIKILTEARSKGSNIYIDVYPYEVSASTMYLLLPTWLTEGGRRELLKRLSNKEIYSEAAGELKGMGHSYNDIIVASGTAGKSVIGKSILSLAQNQGVSPEEIVLNAIIASEDQMIVFYKNSSEELFQKFALWPYAMVATNGVGYSILQKHKDMPHPRSYGTMARWLGHYVREKKLLSLEKAIHKITGLPGDFMGLKDRGAIKKGNFADIVLFDPVTINDRSTYTHPQIPDGISHVFVNGACVIEKGHPTGAAPGVVLHK